MALFQFIAALTFGINVSTTLTFKAGQPTQANSTLNANSSSVVANGVAAVTLTFTARDAYNNLSPNKIISLTSTGSNNNFAQTSGATDANGVFSTTLSSSVAQTKTITATFASNLTESATVAFVPGPVSSVTSSFIASPNSTVANNSNTLTVALRLKDAQNNVISGVTPAFTASGASTTISAASATDANGLSFVTYKTSIAQNMNALATASSTNFLVPIAFVAGPPTAANSSLVASPNALVADGTTKSTLTATARDAQGNATGGISVALSASGGNNTFGASSGVTSASGVFSTMISSTQVQTQTVTATINSSISATAGLSFTVGPASAATSRMTLDPNVQIANNANIITATLTLRDAQGRGISGITPAFTASGNNTLVSATSATNASGQSTASYKTSLAQNENARVVAAGLSFAAAMRFIPGPPSAAYSTFTASPTSLVANGNAQATLSLHLADANNNSIASQAVGFTTAGGAGPFGSVGLITNASGNATNTLTSRNNGPNKIFATASKLLLSTTVTYTAPTAYCSGNANYLSTTAATPTVGPTWVVLGDWNNDGLLDMAYVDDGNKLVAYFDNGSSAFVQQTPVTAPSNQSQTAVTADINADGYLDIMVTGSGSNVISFFLNQGNGSFTAFYSKNIDIGAFGLATADFNADGLVDVVATSVFGGDAQVFFNTGAGIMGGPTVMNTGIYPRGVATGDFNLDGLPDIVVANSNDRSISVFLNAGSGAFGSQTTFAVGGGPYSVAVADVNGNGNLDIVAANSGSDTISVLLGTGTGTFGSQTAYATGDTPLVVIAVDLNGDGRIDLAVANSGASTFGTLKGNGDGTFQAHIARPCSANPACLAAGILYGGPTGMGIVSVSNVSKTYTRSAYSACN